MVGTGWVNSVFVRDYLPELKIKKEMKNVDNEYNAGICLSLMPRQY